VKRLPIVGNGDAFQGTFASSAEDDPVGCFRAGRSEAFGAGIAGEFVMARLEQDGAAPCAAGIGTSRGDDEKFAVVIVAFRAG